MRTAMAMAAMMTAGAATAQQWTTRVPDRAIAGPRSQVMVLGSPHLSGLPDTFTAVQLAPLLDRLATWKPDGIAIEGVSGEQCDVLRRYVSRYPDVAESYCVDTAPAAKATGLDVPAATTEMDRLLAAGPTTSAQRRRLAAVMLAAGEPASALVQWLRLAPVERRADGALDATLVAALVRAATRRDESYMIASVLAARLGHERVWTVDDHTADAAIAKEGAPFEATMKRIWTGPALKRRMADNARVEAGVRRPRGGLALYRFYNDSGQAKAAFDSDFGRALADVTPESYGRRYVGWWETRNLRMVANMREVLARKPGMRLLAVVGASHKTYYEAYLAPMHDVRIADVRPLLK